MINITSTTPTNAPNLYVKPIFETPYIEDKNFDWTLSQVIQQWGRQTGFESDLNNYEELQKSIG